MKNPTALLIEDEALPRQRLREGLAELWPEPQLLAEAEDGERGLALVLELRPDIVFVDIRLPGLDGLQLARHIKGLCHVVFVTAYDAHALAAFDQGAVDYLLKPLSTERLRETLVRLQQRLLLPPAELARWLQQWAPPALPAAAPAAPLRWLQASQADRLHLVMVADVSHFRSDNKYTCAITADGEFLLRLSLRELLAQIDPGQFWQIHRAVVVNLAQVARVERHLGGMDVLLKDGRTRLQVSQSFQPRFKPM
ncbi:LytR/AlgR family response regulator transcription factor [Roseateles saccharophilus]|uniref:LytTR family two component transcriptional regulator n=1 Tax=Roseateles saccharophilus TaxID=304 RepID=A0A4R3VEZ5_ROSSA|nr:response regulator transcription factor [Roseateles saccharophilus]MDG0832525.1 response regulator transcription factor [Roseateles saccharophilus]TCV03987.1 LytTR family two component transcriptional regulator [Roseateles saccharophilus]